MIKKLVSFLSISIMAASIVACGGGGSSGDNAPLPLVDTESGGQTTQDPPVITTPTPAPQPAPATGLNRLLGTVTFAYQFTGTSTVFSAQASFSSNSYSDTGLLVAGAADRAMVCDTLPSNPSFEFLCLLVRSTDGSGQITSQNIFVFSLTNATEGTGLFEFCSGDALVGNNCVNALLSQPDGSLAVGITQQLAKASGASTFNGLAVTEAESDVFHAAVKAEFGNPRSAMISQIAGGEDLARTYEALVQQVSQ